MAAVIADGASLRFDVKASDTSFLAQLTELLQARDVSPDELGLLYCYKHGVSINQAMKLIGFDGKLVDFLCSQNRSAFSVSGKMVGLKGESVRPALPPWGLNKEKKVAMPPPGLESECVSAEPEAEHAENQQYLELHNRICGRSSNSKIAQTLSDIVEVVTRTTFLSVEKVVKGGSIAKGSAISGSSDAEIVFFVRGVPQVGHDKWLPPLLRATYRILSEHLGTDSGVDGLSVTEDSVHMRVKGIITVDLRFSPVFDTFSKVIQTIASEGPEVRRHYTSSLVQERTQFIAKQPGQVKITIRLLKWWRDQQEWSSKLFRPADEILELLAVHSALQSKPADQRIAVANVMLLLSQFNDLRIVWSNYYSKDDVWSPLLRQRPLLMDPTNPFVNIADAQCFDPREMMKLAQTSRFLG